MRPQRAALRRHRATRQLAKRQITWLRGELDARWFDPDRDGSDAEASRAVARFIGAEGAD